jgi:hypothetical protein
MIRHVACLLLLMSLSCSEGPSRPPGFGGDAGAQDANVDASDVDGAALSCDPMWPAIDTSRACTDGLEVARGVCVSKTTHTKGIYELCAVRPDGVWFYVSVPTDVRITASDGWSFGPAWLANILSVHAITAAEDAVCEGIVQSPSGLAVPACGDSGSDDAATSDAFSEQ